ncbi:MAG: hypothetical protein GF333_05175 [Candidatus Omnitrophica bacterium]|nr:hypothetical protein [Candidatus Omnitrophota bacterium]
MKFEREKRIFVVAKAGRAKDIPLEFIKKYAPRMRGAGIHAMSMKIHSRRDLESLGERAPLLKRRNVYVVANMSTTLPLQGAYLPVDAFQVEFSRLRQSQLLPLVQSEGIPVFADFVPKDLPSVKKFLGDQWKKRAFPLVLMASAAREEIFRSLSHIRKKSLYTGYTDRTEGVVSGILALSWGAQVVEKRIRTSRASGVAHSYSFDELKIYASLLKETKRHLG